MEMSPGFRRALALGLLGLLCAVLWRAAAAPAWRAFEADREAVDHHRDTIARLRGIAAAGSTYQSALERLRSQGGLAGAIMESQSDTLAAAELQQRVKALVEGAGGSLVSAQPTDSQAAGPFTRIGLSVRMVIDTPALQRVLHALESESPVVVIDDMLVLSRGARSSRRRVVTVDELDARLQLAAFVSVPRERR